MLKNLQSGEVLYRVQEQGDNRHLKKLLWKDDQPSGPIFERRSVRHYRQRAVEEEKIELLLRAAMQAPSAKNQQPWEIIVLENRKIMKELALGLDYGKMLDHAPLCFIMLGNMDNLKSPLRWPQDLAAATQNVLLEATEIGLGSVWVSLYPDEQRMGHVREVMDVEESLIPFNIIALGYPQEFPAPVDRFDRSKVHRIKE
ncbi:MAG: nitroreductase family protein [Tissierellia bacterium]|nr:nitroreductase family protein [Tissierellia bacterium]